MTTATKEQLDALTVPATLPGVVRLGTPIVLWGGPTTGVVTWFPKGELPRVSCHSRQQPLEQLSVDLTDATGRAHVAWAVSGDLYDSRVAQCVAGGWLVGGRLYYSSSNLVGAVVPGLKGLNRRDGTTLPDGSRLVDALALRAVALHVLGGAA